MSKPIEKLGRVSSASVLKCTRKNWDQWVTILNKAGADRWPHPEIVLFLKKKFKLPPWWQQGVAIGYEIFTGQRIEGQNLKGEYSTVATKTFLVGSRAAWRFMWSAGGLEIWLKPLSEFKLKVGSEYEVYGGIFGKIRTVTVGQKVRMTWQEADWPKPSILQVLVVPRPKGKSVIVIQHENLKDSGLKLKMRTHWKKVLTDLAENIPKSNLKSGALKS